MSRRVQRRPVAAAAFGDLPRMPAAVGPAAGSAVALGRNPVGQWMARIGRPGLGAHAVATAVGAGASVRASRRPRRSAAPRWACSPSWASSSSSASSSCSCRGAASASPDAGRRQATRRSRSRPTGRSGPRPRRDRARRGDGALPRGLCGDRPRPGHRACARPRSTSSRRRCARASTSLYGARSSRTAEVMATFEAGDATRSALTRGPARTTPRTTSTEPRSSVHRVDMGSGDDVEVVTRGDKAVSGGQPHRGAPADRGRRAPRSSSSTTRRAPGAGGPRTRPGAGTLARLDLQRRRRWGADHGDVETYTAAERLPHLRRRALAGPDPALSSRRSTAAPSCRPRTTSSRESDEVADFRQLYIDFDLWALDDEGVQKYKNGRYEGGFMVADPPDACGPAARPRLPAACPARAPTQADASSSTTRSGTASSSSTRPTGATSGSGRPAPTDPPWRTCAASTSTPKAQQKPEAVVWVTPEGVYEAELTVPSTRDPSATEKPTKRDRRDRGERDSG